MTAKPLGRAGCVQRPPDKQTQANLVHAPAKLLHPPFLSQPAMADVFTIVRRWTHADEIMQSEQCSELIRLVVLLLMNYGQTLARRRRVGVRGRVIAADLANCFAGRSPPSRSWRGASSRAD